MCVIQGRTETQLCPVLALLQYTGVRMTQPPGSFFLMSSGAHVTKPWFTNQITDIPSELLVFPRTITLVTAFESGQPQPPPLRELPTHRSRPWEVTQRPQRTQQIRSIYSRNRTQHADTEDITSQRTLHGSFFYFQFINTYPQHYPATQPVLKSSGDYLHWPFFSH